MGVLICAFNGLYSMIARDPDTAAGGVDPSETIYHADGFQRYRGEELETLPGDGLDRRMQITYNGTTKWHTYADSVQNTRMRSFTVTIRVGYFAGDHVDETMAIMADDEQVIAKAIAKSANWPDCTNGCVNGYVPKSSNVLKLDPRRYILEIPVEVQVTG